MLKKFLIVTSTIIEWFDFVIFVYLSSYIADYFLSPLLTKSTKEIIMLSLIIIPYVIRPIGGLLLGYMSDKLERKYILLITIVLMSISSLGVIFIPSYNAIGSFAAILLLLCRMAQSFSIGGEYIVATIILYENTTSKRKYFSTSLINMSTVFGSLLGILAIYILSKSYTTEEIKTWYWKIPFMVSSILLILVWYIRKIKLSSLQNNNFVAKSNFKLKIQKNAMAMFFYLMFGGVAYYFFVVMGKNILLSVGLSNNSSTLITVGGMLSLLISIPAAGWLADKYGALKLQAIGIPLILLVVAPYKYILLNNNLVLGIISEIILGALLALYLGVMPGFMSSLIPSNVRGITLGIVYNLALSVFGALTPLIIVLLLKRHNYGDILYLILSGIISLIALYVINKNNAYS